MKTGKRNPVKKLWSTGLIASLVGVDVKCVAHWIDHGHIKGVRFPGTKERRVHRDELRRFLAANEYQWALDELDREEADAGRAAVAPR